MSREELERIEWGPEPGQQLGGLGSVRIVARCPGNTTDVLRRTREVMKVVCSISTDDWPTLDEWRTLLPQWFVDACGREPTREELDVEMQLPLELRLQRADESHWDLASWIYWFQPENRYWFWWDAASTDEDTLVIALEVTEWPFPWDALKWLVKAAGAASVTPEQ